MLNIRHYFSMRLSAPTGFGGKYNVDSIGDQQLNVEEFRAHIREARNRFDSSQDEETEEECDCHMNHLFAHIDKDGNAKISPSEVDAFLAENGSTEKRQLHAGHYLAKPPETSLKGDPPPFQLAGLAGSIGRIGRIDMVAQVGGAVCVAANAMEQAAA